MEPPPTIPPGRAPLLDIARVSFKLGCTSFGGPIAHLAFFREEYVRARHWVDEATYADLVALCQFLPGPASSQVGIGIGTLRAGPLGGLVSWIGFTAPSAILMTAFALLLDRADIAGSGAVEGLKIAAVAIVAHAVWGMARQFCTDALRITLALLATVACLLLPHPALQVLAILIAGVLGWRLLSVPVPPPAAGAPLPAPVSRRAGLACLALFLILLGMLPLLAAATREGMLDVADTFYRAGSLVFGGGHAVLPLLERDTVGGDWLSADRFLAGYGAVQAMPGPLFTFSAFLGADRTDGPNGVPGALLATIAIFLPSFLLVFATLPWWHALRTNLRFRSALAGVNAAVVGILLAALITPVTTSAIGSVWDALLALGAMAALFLFRRPGWQVVFGTALIAQAASSLA
ncbi:MAG: chromate efflux transporter [Chloroflexota bacterium]|nr:chromate efflux transporter [Chloroflexota bacterium]